jgi:hypothetical protein
MPLSSVIGSSSIMQPGVCTSTTRPASPYDGQVIYETDTDKIAVYDSSAWVYKTGTTAPTTPTAPGLAFISTTTITSQTSVAFDNVFTSTYDNYLVMFDNFAGSVAADLRLQFRYAGPTTQAASYYAAIDGYGYDGTAMTAKRQTNTSSLFVLAYSTGSDSCSEIVINNAHVQPNFTLRTKNAASGYYIGQGFSYGSIVALGFILTCTSNDWPSSWWSYCWSSRCSTKAQRFLYRSKQWWCLENNGLWPYMASNF